MIICSTDILPVASHRHIGKMPPLYSKFALYFLLVPYCGGKTVEQASSLFMT